ncbi:MAG: hypothetical protein P4L72_15075 [Parvibaculum sp.]|jgi:hypothetical protein|uniref:hypothetical protein n=1 Tax=Parvibaculum sp. TaxID=2024848 RepID=UPI00284C9D73|nr:hypothetical protein [Parvibaculum sp.]MDR3500535.1 hypothetical protein [Parvibaculum sp.]
MTDASAFELSRAYAAGWNAAKTQGEEDRAPKNPFPADGEAHKRWAEGYEGAQGSRGAITKTRA